jgi:hypothetical protein
MVLSAPKTNQASPSAWTLRDEMAMRLAAAMIIKGGWGITGEDGTHSRYSTMADYSIAAYAFAEHMLIAREKAA